MKVFAGLAMAMMVTMMATAFAQTWPGGSGARGAMFDLMAMLSAVQEMEVATDLTLDAEQAEALLLVLRELQAAETLTPDDAEITLSAIEGILTPQQLMWVDMKMLEPPAPQAEDGEAPGFLGRLFGGGRLGGDRPQGDREARRAALEEGGFGARESWGDAAMRGGQSGQPGSAVNPFSRPPLSENLVVFIDILAHKVAADAGN